MNMDMDYSRHSQGMGIVPTIIIVAFGILMIASMWKVFAKAGKPGWAAIIPIYNIIVLLEVARKPLWWIVLLLIPIVSLVAAILVAISVANNFGKSAGFGLGLAFLGPIFYPILAFGSARYVAPSAFGGLPMARAANY